ncbi:MULTISPECIES: type-F conjugative transfer system protein TrbI [unclassified Sphingomonas]|uniref:type-F conjugative transfer system protein TrbI n=1 Tax=unclassified Sphingomonas TaxID=196159 RepID=UPI00092A06FA|nr:MULTISPECIES: type-F conjugative transfer system protein TrbI [unclassified Sphingomonas]MBN8848028.1 type-F conjugative transfer system protein TrbI [Sphingomonas sp.]OJV29736.1 MAG: hypothetical protein BGO24_18790 [Sphingomonas sp. 67-36]
MADQPELDLPRPAAQPPFNQPAAQPRRAVFAGLSAVQLVVGLLAIAALVWAMWVTRVMIAPKQDRIVSARLSSIVGEYVQAEARSASPPGQVEAEMRRFMASLDHELQRRSAGGEVVLVGEAVLTKNVPDITDSLRQAVYASGVARPRVASAADLAQLQARAAPAAAPMIAGALPPAVTPPVAVPVGQGPALAAGEPVAPPAATVSSFGAPDGDPRP